jgi:ABC-2 type transport system permease protein
VIGRRDFVASVFSRSFLFFLLGPLIIMAVSAGFVSITQNVARESTRTSVAVIADDADRPTRSTAKS